MKADTAFLIQAITTESRNEDFGVFSFSTDTAAEWLEFYFGTLAKVEGEVLQDKKYLYAYSEELPLYQHYDLKPEATLTTTDCQNIYLYLIP